MRCKEDGWPEEIQVIARSNRLRLKEYEHVVDEDTRTIACYIPTPDGAYLDVFCHIEDLPIRGFRADLYVDGVIRGYRAKLYHPRSKNNSSADPIFLTPAYGLDATGSIRLANMQVRKMGSSRTSTFDDLPPGVIPEIGCVEVQLFLDTGSTEPYAPDLQRLELAPLDFGQQLNPMRSGDMRLKPTLCTMFPPSTHRSRITIEQFKSGLPLLGRRGRPWATFRFLYRDPDELRRNSIAAEKNFCVTLLPLHPRTTPGRLADRVTARAGTAVETVSTSHDGSYQTGRDIASSVDSASPSISLRSSRRDMVANREEEPPTKRVKVENNQQTISDEDLDIHAPGYQPTRQHNNHTDTPNTPHLDVRFPETPLDTSQGSILVALRSDTARKRLLVAQRKQELELRKKETISLQQQAVEIERQHGIELDRELAELDDQLRALEERRQAALMSVNYLRDV